MRGRIQASKSPNRRRVQTYVEEHPGCCQQEIAAALGLARNAIAHHLRSLERLAAVTQVRQGRRLLLFPKEVHTVAERFALGMLRRTTAAAILREVAAEPSVPWRELARRLSLAPHTIRWHVNRLQQDGVIVVLPRYMGAGHVVHVHPAMRPLAIGDGLSRTPARAEPALDAEVPVLQLGLTERLAPA